MKVEENSKYRGSCQMIAAMIIFLLAAFLPGISYADNPSPAPEMNQFTPVISVPQNQDAPGTDIKPETPDATAVENESLSDQEDARMRLLSRSVDDFFPPMDSDTDRLEFLLAKLDKAAADMEADFEFIPENDDMDDDVMEQKPSDNTNQPGVLNSKDVPSFNPTGVSLTMGGGNITLDAPPLENNLVERLQETDMSDEDLEEEKNIRQEDDIAATAPASVLEASDLPLEGKNEDRDRELSVSEPPGNPFFSAFASPASINFGALMSEMFFPAEKTVEMPPDTVPEPQIPKTNEWVRMTEKLDISTLAPPIPAESAPDPVLLAKEMGLLATLKEFEPKTGGEKPMGDDSKAAPRTDKFSAENRVFSDATLMMALDYSAQSAHGNLMRSASKSRGIFQNIVNTVMPPLVAMVPSLSEASRAYAPTSSGFFFNEAPSRPTNFLEERFNFVSYALPSVSYYRSKSGYSSYSYGSYGSNSDGKKRRRRYYF